MLPRRPILLALYMSLCLAFLIACRDQTLPATPTTSISEPTVAPTATPPAESVTIDWPPQLVYSSPTPGEETLLDGAITLRFDQPMDQASVAGALSVLAVGAAAETQGDLTWPRPDTLIFTPRGNLARQQLYELNLTTSARAANGQALRAPVTLAFETVGYLAVAQTLPAADAHNVQVDAAITLFFNRPVVPLVATGQQADLPQPLTFDPPVTGVGEWVSSSIYRFTPDVLAASTVYQATVPAGLTDVSGGVLADNHTWSFTTTAPKAIQFEPPPNADSIPPTQAISITFNMPMDRASAEAAIVLEPAAEVSLSWSDDSRRVTLTPNGLLAMETRYRILVDEGTRSAVGQAPMERAASSTFTTYPFPQVESVWPRSGEELYYLSNSIGIQFASPMALEMLEGRIQVEPPLEGVNYYLDPAGIYLNVGGDMTRRTTYQVTIPGDATDIYGNPLGEDYVWSFTTADYPPLASLNLPHEIAQLSVSFPTTVNILHRKLSGLHIALYDFEGEIPVERLSQGYYGYDPNQPPPTGLVRSWDLTLDPLSDDLQTVNLPLAEGGVLPTGVYYVALNSPDLDIENTRWWQRQQALLIVADVNLTVKETPEMVYVWATDLATGQPAAGLNLTFYREGSSFATAITDSQGLAQAPKSIEETQDYYSFGLLVTSNAPGQTGFGVAGIDWNLSVEPWRLDVPFAGLTTEPLHWYVISDRPIYRPGDTAYFRGYARDDNFGRYTLPADLTSVQVTIQNVDAYGAELAPPIEFDVPVDENGGFSWETNLPVDGPLGTYQVSLRPAGQTPELYYDPAPLSFTVAEYRAPEFLVEVTPEVTEALRGEEVTITINASYFFGGPATDLETYWTVYAAPYEPDWQGPWYSFRNDDQTIFGGGFFGAPNPLGDYVLNGQGRTDANGQVQITLPADLLPEDTNGSRRVTIEATVLDITQFPVAARSAVVLHQAEVYIGIQPNEYLNIAGRPASVNLLTLDRANQPAGEIPYEVIFYQREWRSERQQVFGSYETVWEAVDTEVARVSGVTDAQGQGQASFTPAEGGSYVARATAVDTAGRTYTSSAFLYVLSDDFAGWRSDSRDRSMTLVADQPGYQVGDTAQILVQSPFNQPVAAWLTIERGNVLEQEVIILEGPSAVLDIPLTTDYAPNVFVTVTAIKGVDGSDLPYADMRLGIVELVVEPEPFALQVAVTADPTQAEPGSAVTYTIQVTDITGRPVQTDLTLALVDLAVLSLKDDNVPPILDAYYERQPLRSQMGAGLLLSGEGLEIEEPVEFLGGGGGGDGALAESSFALRTDEDSRVRQDFRDTAYWAAAIRTDANGQASTSVTLPDNLTTWRLSVKAITLGDASPQVGQTTHDILSSLPLLIRPVTPRFLTVGDIVQLGAVVNNNLAESVEGVISLEAAGVELLVPPDSSVTIPGRSSRLVRWPVLVLDVSAVDLTFRVVTGDRQDATKPTLSRDPNGLLPVYRYSAHDIVGTAGVLDAAGQQVEAILLPPDLDDRLGGLTMSLTPSLGAAMLESLAVLEQEPYLLDCAHAVADRLLPNAAVAQALQALALERDDLQTQLDSAMPDQIATLTALQQGDGGWSWCAGAKSHPFISGYTLLALLEAEQAGYSVPVTTLTAAENYLKRHIPPADSLRQADEANQQAFYLYLLSVLGNDIQANTDDLLAMWSGQLTAESQALLIMAYANNGGSPTQESLWSDLNASVILSATGANWEIAAVDYANLSSDVRTTAVVLQALAEANPSSPLAPNVARWLMGAREASRWPTAHETAWSILALTRWMAATQELEADYSYSLRLNDAVLGEDAFTSERILASDVYTVPVAELNSADLNFLAFERDAGPGRLYYTAHLDAFVSADRVAPVSRGVTVQRTYYDAACDPDQESCEPVTEITAGQQLRVVLTLIAPHNLFYVLLEDPLPSGAEGIDPSLDTSASGFQGSVTGDDYTYGYWGWWYFNSITFRDEKVVFTSEFLPAGVYQYTYYMQTIIPGTYQVMPAVARQEFFPERFGRSAGLVLTINEP